MHAIASRLCWVKLGALYYVHRRSEAWVRAIREKLVFCPFRRFFWWLLTFVIQFRLKTEVSVLWTYIAYRQ